MRKNRNTVSNTGKKSSVTSKSRDAIEDSAIQIRELLSEIAHYHLWNYEMPSKDGKVSLGKDLEDNFKNIRSWVNQMVEVYIRLMKALSTSDQIEVNQYMYDRENSCRSAQDLMDLSEVFLGNVAIKGISTKVDKWDD